MGRYSTTAGTAGYPRSAQKLRVENALKEITDNPTLKAAARSNLGITTTGSYTTIATAAGTTTLTVSSAHDQFFTGTTTQTVLLPVTSTLGLGHEFYFVNNSTGIVTIQSSGANNLLFLQPGARALVEAIAITGTGTSSWSVANLPNRSAVANTSVTAQTITDTTRVMLTGSNLTIPATGLKIGTIFTWKFNVTKTAAGSATSSIDIGFGTTANASGLTSRVAFTKPAGTAAADEGFFEIQAIVRGPISASGIVVAEMTMIHNLAATGHAQIPCVVVNTVSSAFDVTTAGLIVGVMYTAGASDSLTIQQVTAEVANLTLT